MYFVLHDSLFPNLPSLFTYFCVRLTLCYRCFSECGTHARGVGYSKSELSAAEWSSQYVSSSRSGLPIQQAERSVPLTNSRTLRTSTLVSQTVSRHTQTLTNTYLWPSTNRTSGTSTTASNIWRRPGNHSSVESSQRVFKLQNNHIHIHYKSIKYFNSNGSYYRYDVLIV
jgi:hypothetical protein